MSDDERVGDVAELLADETARKILEVTREEALSAGELAEECGVSEPTVYRRIEDLREHELIEQRTEIDEEGHHRRVYAAVLDRVAFDLTTEGFDLALSRREPMADRFTRLVEEM